MRERKVVEDVDVDVDGDGDVVAEKGGTYAGCRISLQLLEKKATAI